MKKKYVNLLILLLSVLIILSLVSCGDKTNDTDKDSGDNGSGNTVLPPATDGDEKISLIEDGIAKFKIVTTENMGSSIVKAADKFAQRLKDLGVSVDAPIRDTSVGAADCEIILGYGLKNRDEKYVIDFHEYGPNGYVIKVIESKVIILGGTEAMTVAALDYFITDIMNITEETEELTEFKISSTFVDAGYTDFIIDGIDIAGNSLSDYVFVLDTKDMVASHYGFLNELTNEIYLKSGIYLKTLHAEEVADGQKAVIARCVTDAGENGFRAYVDSDANLVFECAYSNAFSECVKRIITDTILDKSGYVSIPDSYTKSYPVNVVYYSQFGAKGNGVAYDFEAIYNTHVFANQSGQKVLGDGPDAKYYIKAFNKTIPIQTDVDWRGATFCLDDTGSEVYQNRGLHLFALTGSAKTTVLDKAKIDELFPNVEIEKGATSLPWIADLIDVVSFVTIKNGHRDYIRWGGNTSTGYSRQDILIVYPDGTLHKDTPVIWDFKAGEQYIHNWAGTKFAKDNEGHPTWFGAKINVHSAISEIKIVEANDEPITVENGFFERKVCRTVVETGYENVYHAYGRGIAIRRCNATLKNITHHKLNEPSFYKQVSGSGSYGSDQWKSYYGVNTSKGNGGWLEDKGRYHIGQSYPYGGMFAFDGVYNSRAVDCNLTGRTVYYEAKTTSSTPIAMGSYDLTIHGSSHVYIENVQQLNDINDTHYWGIMNSNRAKNLFFTDSSLSRFDAHEGFWNGTFTNTTFGRYINVIGGGYLKISGCTRNVGSQFISMRSDYGSTFEGTIELTDCTMRGMKDYRYGMNTSKPYYESGSLYIINTGYDTSYNGSYSSGNAGSFPFLKWDFGYTCYMPQTVIIDNFKVEGSADIVGSSGQNGPNTNLYVFPNTGNAAFEKPSDFVKVKDYTYSYTVNGENFSGTQQVRLADGTYRDMTAEDIYYNQYQITKAIYFKNMEQPIKTCPSSTNYMAKNIPIYLDGVRQ